MFTPGGQIILLPGVKNFYPNQNNIIILSIVISINLSKTEDKID